MPTHADEVVGGHAADADAAYRRKLDVEEAVMSEERLTYWLAAALGACVIGLAQAGWLAFLLHAIAAGLVLWSASRYCIERPLTARASPMLLLVLLLIVALVTLVVRAVVARPALADPALA